MVDEQIDLRYQNGGEWGIQHLQGVAEQGFRQPDRQPPRLVDQKQEKVQYEEGEGCLHQAVFHGLACPLAQDGGSEPIEEYQYRIQCASPAPTQISQAASA